MADDEGVHGVVTMVCITCGSEKHYDRELPGSITCERCSGTVFRRFDTPAEADEAAIDALESQARSMSYGDASPQSSPDEEREQDSQDR